MADTDFSSPILRYNLITGGVEYFNGSDYYPVATAPDAGITQLTGEVTAGPGNGSQAATVTNAAVIGKLLTGYVSGAGTVASTDTILQGFNKLNGNVAATTSVANAALPSASFTDAAVTGKLLTGFSASTGTVASTDSILVAFQKEVANQRSSIPGIATPAGTGTVTPSATNSSQFNITVTGALTLNGPSMPVDGQKIVLRILNDASHSVTLATGSGNFRFGTDITGYTNSVSLTDYIGAIWNNAALRWDVVSVIQGF